MVTNDNVKTGPENMQLVRAVPLDIVRGGLEDLFDPCLSLTHNFIHLIPSLTVPINN